MKILSLGAGVQSSCILFMAAHGEIEKPDHVIFADTGFEPKEVYAWFKEVLIPLGKKHDIPIHIVQQGNIKEDALRSMVRGYNNKEKGERWACLPYFTKDRKTGKLGMIRRQCTYEYKIRPIERKQRELLGYEPRQRIPAGSLEAWKGISIDEMQRATVSPIKWVSFYYPLIEMRMSRHDCLEWFKANNLPTPPRSACICCPYHSNHEWRHILDNSPEEWQEAIEFDKAIRKTGGMRGDVFLHAERIPLDQVDLSTAEDHGQLTLFGDFREDCSGTCGV